MKAQILTLDGTVAGDIDLPEAFSEEYRPDLIKKAVLALQSTRRQPHGTYPYAGIESSAVGWGSGRGVSHVPRIRSGSRAAKVPQAKGGREAHPPVVEKVLVQRINKKEKQKAFRSALAASASEERVRARGHLFSGAVPVVFEDRFEELGRTADVISALTAAGIFPDVERSKQSKKVRAGRGKMRGRRYKQRKSLLIVTADKPLKAAQNLAGVDVVTFDQLNTELLAPGTLSGRLTVFTESALLKLGGQ
ncbi:MAG: 50S ribosomal protein L4 [Methanomicrobiales archaeon]|nr:50S ribosomal protein L4 [Methanomicrobiales archaeon]NYT21292.1 50S ribosomal protein L4 [Methanomicrobiales archaeon]